MWKRISLKKLRNLYFDAYKWYKKHSNVLSPVEKSELESLFQAMDEALMAKDKKKGNHCWEAIDRMVDRNRQKKWWEYPIELLGALTFALIVATIVRQMVFELYEIPTGSMRPTFQEHDHLVVSKTTFGINIPLTNSHFYFDDSLVKRGGVFIFSGEDLDAEDTDTKYFWLFPAKKRYIKRCMGKPGDTFYFYGGLLYAVDRNGQDLTDLRNPPFTTELEHVPFNSFQGRMLRGGAHPKKGVEIIYKHLNQPVGKLMITSRGELVGEVFDGVEWKKTDPLAEKKPHQTIEAYGDFLGISHFGMTRLLTKEQVKLLHKETRPDSDTKLYLEIAHHPQLTPIGTQGMQQGIQKPPPLINGQLAYYTSLLPLTEERVDLLMDHLYTSRFKIEEGRASSIDAFGTSQFDVPLPGIPDGVYEFFDGTAYKIGWMGWSTELAKTHPIYRRDVETVQTFFNYGMEFSTLFNPTSSFFAPFPARYAFYREGDFFVMGRRLFAREDTPLLEFVQQEQMKGVKEPLYLPFVDRGPPMKEGNIDVEFIRTFGYTLKDKEYLALGDNYARSSDSRTFGPIYQGNLEGTPSFILWPPQKRFGPPNQAPYALMSFPTVLIWLIVIGVTLLFLQWDRRRKRLPLFHPKD